MINLPYGITIGGLISYLSSFGARCGFLADNPLPCQGWFPWGTPVAVSIATSIDGTQPTLTCPDGTPVQGENRSTYWFAFCSDYTMYGPAQVSWTFATT